MGTGLWRDGHWVLVKYDARVSVIISKGLYDERGYQPPFDDLPTKADHEARHRIQDG